MVDQMRPLLRFILMLLALSVIAAVVRQKIRRRRARPDPLDPALLPHREKPKTTTPLRPLQLIDKPATGPRPGPPPTIPRIDRLPAALSADLLLGLEWKRFEQLCAGYFRATGWKAELSVTGPDGGVDIYLYRSDSPRPRAIVQCKAWIDPVDVKLVRELFGVMTAQNAPEAFFVTTSSYTQPAREFADGKPIQLLDQQDLLDRINTLPDGIRIPLLTDAFAGDFHTPTCPSCDVKMVLRQGQSDTYFWGCSRYPKCQRRLKVRK